MTELERYLGILCKIYAIKWNLYRDRFDPDDEAAVELRNKRISVTKFIEDSVWSKIGKLKLTDF